MNTHYGKPARILFAGIIAAGLTIPAVASAAESTPNVNDPAATKALYGQIYDQLKDGEVNRGETFQLGNRDATLCMMGKDRKSTRLNSSHVSISYAVFCLKKKKLQK